MKAPETYEGRKKVYEETFESRPYDTKEEAEWKLGKVEEEYNQGGWKTFYPEFMQNMGNKWICRVVLAKYGEKRC